jgi:hypothetical protein
VGRLSSSASRRVKDIDPSKVVPEGWQIEGYGYAIAIGELGYVVGHQADTVARGRLVVVERDLDTGTAIQPDKDDQGVAVIEGDRAKAEKALLALRGPAGDQKAIMRSGAEADIIAGEAFLTGEPIEDTGQVSWEMLSITEFEKGTDGTLIRRRKAKQSNIANQKDLELAPETYWSRYHRPDPMHSDDPTSSLRRVAASCREVILMTQDIEATAKSALSAGMLFVPDEIDFYDDDEDIDDAEPTSLDDKLTEYMSAPITDRLNSNSLVPLILRGPADLGEKIRLISLKDSRTDLEKAIRLRQDALGRLAVGLDIPPEVMTGLGGTNHWSGAVISKDFIEKHILPIGERLARFLTISYLRRVLMDSEDMAEEDAERFELAYDASGLLTRADAAASADRLHAARLISDDTRLEAHGYDPDRVRPSPEEYARRLIEDLAVTPSVTNKALLLGLGVDFEAMGVPPDLLEALVTPAGAKVGTDAEPPAEDRAEAGEPGQPEDPTQADIDRELGPEEPGTDPDSLNVILERIRSVGQSTMERALELAANQVIAKLPGDSTLTKTQCRRLPKLEVLSAVPERDYAAMRLSPENMLARTWDGFTHQAVGWLTDFFADSGVSPIDANERARRIVSDVVMSLDTLALSAFRQPLTKTDGLYVTPDLVLDALASTSVS